MITATHGTKVPNIEITLGMRLAAARHEAHLTQERTAELLGCSRRTVMRWESDERTPPIAVVISYSVITDVNLGWLQTGVVNQASSEYSSMLQEGTEKAPTVDGEGRSYAPRDSNPEPADYGSAGDGGLDLLNLPSIPNTVGELLALIPEVTR